MSAVLPSTAEERERWSRARPEPVELELDDWKAGVVIEPDGMHPNRRVRTWSRGPATLAMTRTWDLPRNPGYPMQVASSRTVQAGGREFQIDTTSVFDGAPKVVQLCWLRGEGHEVKYLVRFVFDACDDTLVRSVLERVRIVW